MIDNDEIAFTEVSLRDTLSPVTLVGDFQEIVTTLNIAAANGKQYAMFQERRDDGTIAPVAFERQNITIVRPREISEHVYTA